MWSMVKMLFRYSFKNKVSLVALSIFNMLSVLIFACLMLLSQNLQHAYNNLVENGNLNNGLVHELYKTTVDNDDPNTTIDESSLTGDEAKEENKRQFLNELNEIIGSQNYRRFKSLDYNASTSGIIYKIIESDVDYTINKVVMYSGHNVIKLKYNFTDIINQANWDLSSDDAKNARLLLLSIVRRANFSDGQNGYQSKFNQLYDKCESSNSDPKTIIESMKKPGILGGGDPLYNTGQIFKRWLTPEADNYLELRDKVYRLSCSIDDTTPVSFNIDNFSSYSVVVPDYVLKNHDKQLLPNNLYEQYINFINSNSITQNEFSTWLKSVPDKYKIKIDNSELLLIGSGISPEFMYPVYDFAHTTPNPKTEIISYGNDGAYNLLYDANRSSPIDNYLIIKYDGLNQSMINQLNTIARKYMSWPSNIQIVYFANDTTNMLSPSGIRLNFLPQLVSMQITLSNMLSIFIFVLTAIIFVFSIKKFIYDNRTPLSILRANGFKKRWITWMMPMFAIIPAFGGGILGYLIATLTQPAFISIYGNFWLIPTSITIINPWIFLICLFLPFIVMSLLAITFTYLTLRKNTKELMSESSRFKTTKLSKIITKTVSWAPVMTRFKASIAFSSLSKLIALTILFSLLSIVTSFTCAISNKFEIAKKDTYSTKKYKYALDFITPTIQGGAYLGQSNLDLGKPIVNENNQTLNFTVNEVDSTYSKLRGQLTNDNNYYNDNLSINQSLTNNVMALNDLTNVTQVGNYSLMHIPSINDSSWQTNDFNYLKYKIQTPFIVDAEIGALGLVSNPWNIARSLMPENAISQANKTTIELWKKMLSDDNKYFNDNNLEQYRSKLSSIGSNSFSNISAKLKDKPLWKIISEDTHNKDGYGYLTYISESEAEGLTDNDKFYYENGNIDDQNYDPNKPLEGWYKIDRKAFAGISFNSHFLIIASKILSMQEYQDYIYKVLYNSVILEQSDETYTKVKSRLYVNDDIQDIEIMGIKPETKFVELYNRQNELVNKKLSLAENVENKNIDQIHNVYADSIMNDKNNYKIIINESAAYQFNLEIGSKIKIDPSEEATRYNPTNVLNNGNIIDLTDYNNQVYEFEVIDIIKTYQYPEFYINQRIANHINNMDLNPILSQSYYNEYIHDDKLGKDLGVISYQIDPWNGIFSNSETNKNLSVNTVIYSSSGLAPASDTIGYNSATYKLIEMSLKAKKTQLTNRTNQSQYISKMELAKALGYFDENTFNVTDETMAKFESDFPTYTIDVAKQIIGLLIEQYGNSPFLSSVDNASYIYMYEQIFDNLSSFVINLLLLTLIIIYTISILSIIILSVDFIGSSIALCAILKALGIYDRTNAFSFLSMFFPAALIGIVLSIPFSILLNNGIKSFLYNFSSILLPLSYQWWIPFVCLLIIATIMALTIGFAIWKLKQQSLTKTISGF